MDRIRSAMSAACLSTPARSSGQRLLLVLAAVVLCIGIGAISANAPAVASAPRFSFSQISSGDEATCGILSADASLICWGGLGFGLPLPAGSFRDVSVSHGYGCAVNTVGVLSCWGVPQPPGPESLDGSCCYASASVSPNYEACVIIALSTTAGCFGPAAFAFGANVSAISGGGNHDFHTACAISSIDGTLGCQSDYRDRFGETDPPPGSYTALATGDGYACAIATADGSIACWGRDDKGQTAPPTGSFSAISAGNEGSYTCAVRSADGSLDCWGDDSFGQTDAPAGSYSAVSAGRTHACAIRSTDSSVVCWGSDFTGERDVPGPNQHISFQGPTGGTYGGSTTLSGTGGDSGNPVVFSVDATSGEGVCAVSGISGSTLSYTGAGTCVVDANEAAGDGYGIGTQVQSSIIVAKAPLTVKVQNATRLYGQDDPEFGLQTTGLKNGDTATTIAALTTFSAQATIGGVIYPSSPSSPPGAYQVTASGTSSNYNITYVGATMKVGKAVLKASVDPSTRVVGQPDPSFTVTYIGLANGETPDVLNGALTFTATIVVSKKGVKTSYVSSPTSPAGVYTVKASGQISPDYTINYTPGKMTVTKS